MTLSSQNQLKFPTVRGYNIWYQIGSGGFSKVFVASTGRSPAQGSQAAVKLVFLSSPGTAHLPALGPVQVASPDEVKLLKKEVQVHRTMKHPYVLEFIDSLLVDKQQQRTAMEEDEVVPGLYMLLELAVGGDLFDKIAPDVGISDQLGQWYFSQLISGLSYIHGKGICHRDLKPENLLLGADGNLKVSDFGLCAVYKHQGKERLLSGRCGSLPYVAPELNTSGGYQAEPVDMWGAGVVLFTLLVGNTPWDEPTLSSPEFEAFVSGELLKYDPWTRISPEPLEILLGLLAVNPKERLTIQQISNHPWMLSTHGPEYRPTQISRSELGRELTRGLRESGHMDLVNPPLSQPTRAANASQYRSQYNSQYGSQMTSQFMQTTGMVAEQSDGSFIDHRQLNKFHLRLAQDEAARRIVQCIVQMVDENNLQIDQTIRLQVRDKRKQWMRGEIRILDGAYGEESTLVEVVKTGGDPLEWRRFFWELTGMAGLTPYLVK
ncbi:hypothetical protein QFC21_002075 [Naganishia friedmannii]|uniref:Uncharacterized protein n=1 Tax=Naganishia friedmannii TaxID=89922 RepID=A0ACC2W0E4_9TREE|nr:hypothetical protein QFC21_002075 [Naganishia friedmannii]